MNYHNITRKYSLFLIILFFTGNTGMYSHEKDAFYNYIGKWKIISRFHVDIQYFVIGDMSYRKADKYLDEVIEYKEDSYIFRDTVYTYEQILSEYFDDEQLWKATVGSAVPGLRFYMLGIPDDTKEIRNVMIDVAGREWPKKNPIGWFFYVINNERILIHYRGFFFTAIRL